MPRPDADPLSVFGDNVRAARQQAGLTQEALGLEADLHPTEINRLERGHRNPGLLTIIKLAQGLDVPAATLVQGL